MKCPKCNYTSFDYNQVCPKCGKDNTEEQTRLKISRNKPNPPFFLASLVGMTNSENLEIPGRGDGMDVSEGAPGGMDAQDLLIALDDLDSDDARPDSQEPLDPSKDEVVFETDDPKVGPDPGEDEILFDLEPASEEKEFESIDSDLLHKKGFTEVDGPVENQTAADVAEMPSEKQIASVEEIPEKAHEKDLFLTDEPDSAETPAGKTDPSEITHKLEASNSQELFLSLDDLPDSDAKTESSASSSTEKDEILFELEEASEQGSAPAEKEAPGEKGFWNSDEINEQLAAFDLEEAATDPAVVATLAESAEKDASPKEEADGKEDVNLFSDMDIEPLDLELSLEDMEKKPD